MRRLRPEGDATVFKPLVQFFQILEDRHNLPKAVPRIPDVLLNLAFLPACCWIAELRFKDVMAGHSFEARVDITLLAAPNTVDCRLHIVIDATPWNAAKHAEGMPVRINNISCV